MLKFYPEFRERFAKEITHDLTYNLREGYDDDVSFIFGILFPKLFWPTVKKIVQLALEQFIQTVKGKINFGNRRLFLTGGSLKQS